MLATAGALIRLDHYLLANNRDTGDRLDDNIDAPAFARGKSHRPDDLHLTASPSAGMEDSDGRAPDVARPQRHASRSPVRDHNRSGWRGQNDPPRQPTGARARRADDAQRTKTEGGKQLKRPNGGGQAAPNEHPSLPGLLRYTVTRTVPPKREIRYTV